MTARLEHKKFIVIKTEHLHSLGPHFAGALIDALTELDRKHPGTSDKTYYVCNTDEPYAEAVLEVILTGEDAKLSPHDPDT